MSSHSTHETGCGCGRRSFMTAMGTGTSARSPFSRLSQKPNPLRLRPRNKPPSYARFFTLLLTCYGKRGNGGCWPGNDFDAEGRHKQYAKALREMETKLGVTVEILDAPIQDKSGADRFVNRVKQEQPDGILLIPFFNGHFGLLDGILAATSPDKDPTVPALVYCCSGRPSRIDREIPAQGRSLHTVARQYGGHRIRAEDDSNPHLHGETPASSAWREPKTAERRPFLFGERRCAGSR